jgi:hypothetical protein
LLALGTPRQLARTIVAEIRLKIEIDPEHVDIATAILHRFTEEKPSVDASGLAITGILHDQIPDVLTRLVAAGVRVYRVDHDEPTLEDVYFALHTAASPEDEREVA